MIQGKYTSKDPQTLHTTVQIFNYLATWHQGFAHTCLKHMLKPIKCLLRHILRQSTASLDNTITCWATNPYT